MRTSWEHFSHGADMDPGARPLSFRDVAEEAPGAYKDVSAVVEAADKARLASKVAKLLPVICIKG